MVAEYLKKITDKPKERDSYSWADYLELICISNIDGELSDSDVIDRLKLRAKDLKEATDEEIKEDEALESEEGQKATNRGIISDRWEIKLRDWFTILNMRKALYGEFYPFEVNGQELIFTKRKLTTKQRVYVYLLLCSNLNLFEGNNISKLTDSFELFSFEAFKKILPSDAEVHLFGKNSLNRTGPFRGSLSLWKKMGNFSDLINETLTHRMAQADYPEINKGDGGLDIVAWIPTKDKLSSKIVFLGQCACGEDWKKKQSESSFDDWSPRIDFTNFTLNNFFIPYCYRQSNGNWHKAGDIKKAFLIDRKRLLEYLFKTPKGIKELLKLEASKFVDVIVKTKEAVV